MTIKIDTSKQNAREEFAKLKTGDTVLLSGIVLYFPRCGTQKIKSADRTRKTLTVSNTGCHPVLRRSNTG